MPKLISQEARSFWTWVSLAGTRRIISPPKFKKRDQIHYWNEWLRQSFGYWNFVLIINLQRVYCVPHTCKSSLFVCLEEVWELTVSILSRRLGDRGGVRLYWPMRIGGKVQKPGTSRPECGRLDFVASYENRPRTWVDVPWGCASGKPKLLKYWSNVATCVHHAYNGAAPTCKPQSAWNKFDFDLCGNMDTEIYGWVPEVNWDWDYCVSENLSHGGEC